MVLQAGPTVSWTSEVEQTEDGPRVVLTGEPGPGIDHISGTIDFMSCIGTKCNMPEDWEFDLYLDGKEHAQASEAPAPASPALQLPGSLSLPAPDSGASAPETTVSEAEPASSGSSLWGLILEAILWGFAMLLTPCVFPMVPMTISFFLKGSGSATAGRFKAMMYGLFIVLL